MDPLKFPKPKDIVDKPVETEADAEGEEVPELVDETEMNEEQKEEKELNAKFGNILKKVEKELASTDRKKDPEAKKKKAAKKLVIN